MGLGAVGAREQRCIAFELERFVRGFLLTPLPLPCMADGGVDQLRDFVGIAPLHGYAHAPHAVAPIR
jgi:hypothetical protein